MRAAKLPSATARTISLFTGKTDIDDKHARDGSKPDPVSDFYALQVRPKRKWHRYELTQYLCDEICAVIRVENERPRAKDGRWFYRVEVRGQAIGRFDSICEAADAAEGVAR